MVKNKSNDLEVDIKDEGSRAVIEGKTSVQFKKFVGLILQRKVMQLLKDSGEEPIIVSSDLLTNLASAPQDSQENRSQLVLVTLGVGVIAGIFICAIGQIAILSMNIVLSMQEYAIIAGSIIGLAVLASLLGKMKRRNRSQKLTEVMEQLTGLLSK